MGRVALLFPGQGAQSVGMGRDVAERSPAAAKLLARIDAALASPVTPVMFEGPEKALRDTATSQPAIVAHGLAVLAAMEERGARPAFEAAAGLSLGEYAALAAAGAIDPVEAVRLVAQRGALMKEAAEAREGSMVSVIGLEAGKVEAAVREAQGAGTVVVANYNCPGQLVISGECAAVERAAELCREAGAKRVIVLKVSGAFHSPLMESAAAALAPRLEEAAFAPGRVPVIANATAEYVRDPDEIRRALTRQVTGSVLWERSMRRLVDDGFDTFYEVGPGRVLAGLMKRIAPEVGVTSVGTASALEELPIED